MVAARWRATMACIRTRAVRLLAMRRHQHEHQQGDDILRIGDGEGVERRQEEEIIGQRADQAGEQRRPQAISHGAGQHRHQQHQRHIGNRQRLAQQQAHAQRRRR